MPQGRTAEADQPRLRRYALLALAIVCVLLTTFVVVEALDVTALSDPERSLDDEGAATALLGVGLLVVDALLPVASSVVMIALGAAYGAPLGVALAWLGRLAMALVGFGLGRRGGPLVERLVGEAERARADALLERRGAMAIVVSRPIPLLAETVTVLAGASPMPWRRAVVAAAVGSVPEALAYGLAGAYVGLAEGVVLWCSFAAIVAGFWLAERAAARRLCAATRS